MIAQVHKMSWSAINHILCKWNVSDKQNLAKLSLCHAPHWQTRKQHIGDFSQTQLTKRATDSWDCVVINNQHVRRQLELHMQMRRWLSAAGLPCQGHWLWFKVTPELCVALRVGLVRRLTATSTCHSLAQRKQRKPTLPLLLTSW